VGISRRELLLGFGAIAAPAIAGARQKVEPVLLHFNGASSSPTVRILDGRQPSRFPIDLTGARDYISLLQAPPSRESAAAIERLSRELYIRLWRPVSDRQIKEADVYIRATGVLKNFPFESLRGEAGFVGQSVKVRHLLGRRRWNSVHPLGPLHFGENFVYAPVAKNGLELPRLPAAVQEAHIVKQMMHGQIRIGPQANKEQLRRDISAPFSLLHFATHGTKSVEGGPCLALRKLHELDGDGIELLSPSEIRAMRMNGRLVVLSACESAVKSDSGSALGLGEAFVKAGAKEVIATRWAVDDAAALVFMKALYLHLSRGRDSGSALRYARASMIKSEFLPYSSPYFWAGFVSLTSGGA